MSIEQIDLFLENYDELLKNPSSNHNNKLHVYAEYLKHKKHFLLNNIDDSLLSKSYGLSKYDMMDLENIFESLEYGHKLYKKKTKYISNIQANDSSFMYSNYNDNDDHNNNNGFDLLNEVSDAMDNYYKKMNKIKRKQYGRKVHSSHDETPNVYNVNYEQEQYNLDHPIIETNLMELPNDRFNQTVSLTSYEYPHYHNRNMAKSSRQDNRGYNY